MKRYLCGVLLGVATFAYGCEPAEACDQFAVVQGQAVCVQPQAFYAQPFAVQQYAVAAPVVKQRVVVRQRVVQPRVVVQRQVVKQQPVVVRQRTVVRRGLLPRFGW